jgi:hypothetical protein
VAAASSPASPPAEVPHPGTSTSRLPTEIPLLTMLGTLCASRNSLSERTLRDTTGHSNSLSRGLCVPLSPYPTIAKLAFRVTQDNIRALRRLVALQSQHADAAQVLIRVLRRNASMYSQAGQDGDAGVAKNESQALIVTLRKSEVELDFDLEPIF